MSDHSSAFSRRKVLTGLGLSVGAAAVSGLALPDLAGAAPGDSSGVNGLGTVADLAPQALPVTAGLAYVVCNTYAFRPIDGGVVSVNAGGAYSTDTLAAPLYLPHGAILKEIDAWGNGPTTVQVWRAPHDNLAAWVKINEIIVPDGSGPQTAHGAIAEELVNLGDNSYTVVAAGTSITQGINSVRVGYRPAPTVVPISPIARVLDTRAGAKLAAGSDTLVNLGLPAAAQSAILTLTVTETTGSSGYIGVYPGNVATWPGNSNINWFDAGQNLATGVTTAVSSTGTIKLHVGENATHVIVDVQGYLA